ncbi:RNA polymerase sigma factor [Streptomyces sp. NBC_00103]|uniref:RNA polymerase sigma factor n=1 Tax=Streptomyces sp. NBC_00103 TaxID=2975653 RepID=UPI0022560F02|nr:RNA polymerase sigma factor [Streptomyces sp. NBC_00103]MCX5369651.1 RNA polymerase sigma factor [Streptomyces sp. NBC_00103]
MRARVRGGERAAFAELYELYAAAVYHHALRLTGDWSVAEEVMSETFLAAWRGRGAVEAEGGSLRPWLFGIATNKARNADRSLRRRLAFLARRAEAGAGTGGDDAVGDFAEDVVGRIDDARRLAEVRRVLGRLRRHEREVLALCVWGGLDYAQAAEALGVPLGTVRSRLSRARARLREIVERETRQSGRTERRTERHTERRTERRTGRRTEPRSRRGEVESETAFAVLPIQEEAR